MKDTNTAGRRDVATKRESINAARRRAWLEENQQAIADYNELAERRGLFSDEWRKF